MDRGRANNCEQEAAFLFLVVALPSFGVLRQYLQFLYRDSLADTFMPYQFGAGAPLGAETVIHMTRTMLLLHPDWSVLKIDFKNAFNTIFRKTLFDSVAKHAPGLLSWVQANHINATKLWHKCLDPDSTECDVIWSAEGVQQGEVGGPTNFCLAVQDILNDINTSLSGMGGGMLLGYMDDLTLVAHHTTINQVWHSLVSKAAAVGLQINLSKCQIYHPDMQLIADELTIPSDIVKTSDGVVMLGVPIGTEEYEYTYWSDRMTEFTSDINMACSYEDAQVALLFLTKCVSTQLNYFTRMTDPNSQAGLLANNMDEALCHGLNILLKKDNITTEDNCWIQARLAAKHGGLGIQSPKISHPGAYLSSLIGCHSTLTSQLITLTADNRCPAHCQHIQHIIAQLYTSIVIAYETVRQLSIAGGSAIETLDEFLNGSIAKLQKRLTIHVSNYYFQMLWNRSSVADRIRLDSCSAEGSALITTVPKFHYCTMDAEQFIERICTRLGLAVAYIQAGTCTCGKASGVDGFHLQSSCAQSAQQKTNTHNAVRDVWYELGIAAGLRCRTECSRVFKQLNIDAHERMDNVFECYDGARPLLGDVAIVDARKLNSADYADGSDREYVAGAAGLAKEQSKITTYNVLQNANVVFEPLIFEALGRWAPRARVVFKNLIHRVHIATGTPKFILYPKWRGKLCFAQHKTAAAGLKYRSDVQDIRAQQIRAQQAQDDDYAYPTCNSDYRK